MKYITSMLRKWKNDLLRNLNKPRLFTIAYVILLNNEAHNLIRKLQIDIFNQYGMHAGLNATPHITIKLGITVNTSELQKLIEYFDNLVSEIEPFEIKMIGFGYFEEGIVYLDIEQDEILKNIRNKTLEGLQNIFGIKPYPIEGDNYHFHATLLHGLPKKYLKNIYKDLTGKFIEFKFVPDTFGILCLLNGRWIVYKKSKLLYK